MIIITALSLKRRLLQENSRVEEERGAASQPESEYEKRFRKSNKGREKTGSILENRGHPGIGDLDFSSQYSRLGEQQWAILSEKCWETLTLSLSLSTTADFSQKENTTEKLIFTFGFVQCWNGSHSRFRNSPLGSNTKPKWSNF
ncbi:hypothetical protein CEXT_34061 [Caerostris extrusa]|uniref:Uncharacterized protein n=1 Tax=Caerostris extrusa TaxID=172846 RepID=A0AAV4P388_CAEEX|nr:hypothetical protein CEXT_34061 [Caerostris extrusa]